MQRTWAQLAGAVVLACAVITTGCGDDHTPTPTPTPTPDTLTITCPSAQSGLSLKSQPVTMSWTTPTTTGGTSPVQVTCSPASGSSFSAGVTTVTCAAADAATQRVSCAFAVTITRPPQTTLTRILALGDSITWGRDYPALPITLPPDGPAPITSYPSVLWSLLSARYTDQTVSMTNAGWPGELIATGAGRLPSLLSEVQPNALLLLHGANDLLAAPERTTTAYIAGKLRDMVRTAKNQRPGITILLANFPPQYHGSVPRDRGVGAEFVPELNQLIAQVAQTEGATLVDLYTPMLGDLRYNISGDGLHPTVKGFGVMADTFFTTCRQVGETTTTTTTAVR